MSFGAEVLRMLCVRIYVLSHSTIVLSAGAIFAASVLVMRIIRSLYHQIIVSSDYCITHRMNTIRANDVGNLS